MTRPTHTRTRSAAGLAAAGLALLLAGCSAAAADSTTVVVGTPNTTGLHRTLVASGQDQNTAQYTIEYADFDSTPPLIEALNAGEVDIASGGETGVLFAIGNGADIALTGAYYTDEDAVSAVLVKNESDAQSLSDLKGKSIALPHYTKQHYQLAEAIEAEGLTWDDFDIINLDTTTGLAALNNGEVDAFIVWDPNAAATELENDSRVLLNLFDVSADPGAIYVRRGALEDEATKDALVDTSERIVGADAWVADNQDEWAEQVAELSGLSPEVAEHYVSRSAETSFGPIDEEVIDAWQAQVDYFVETGQISERYDVADYVDNSFDGVFDGSE